MGVFNQIARAAEPSIEGAMRKVWKAVRTPAIPEAMARGTAEDPALMRGVSNQLTYEQNPAIFRSMKEKPPPPPTTIEDAVQSMKDFFGSFMRADPNVAKDIQKKTYNWRSQHAAAEAKTDGMLRGVYEPLQRDPVRQLAKGQDFMVLSDENAQALADGRTHSMGKPIEETLARQAALETEIQGDPEIFEMITRRTALITKIFNDMVQRGWITPTRTLESYTHIRKVQEIIGSLAAEEGVDFNSVLIEGRFLKGKHGSLRGHDILKLEQNLVQKYLQKVAKHDAFFDLMSDPTINLTRMYRVGEKVGRGHVAYNPAPNDVGHVRLSPEEQIASGMTDEITRGFGDVVTPGAYVIPKSLARVFKEFRPPQLANEIEGHLYRAGRMFARNLTVYNPANTRLNQWSDALLAMFGLPGEKANPLGVMRFYPSALKAAQEIAVGKKSFVKINNQVIDVRKLVEDEALGESMLFHEVQNKKISDELARLYPESVQKQEANIFDVLSRDRFSTELAPRLAAGMAAFEKTGDLKEFGRIGREITLTYGAGAPRASKIPIIRFLSPFLQFQGLATGRVIDMLNTPGSQARTIVGLMAVPVTTWMWNTRNSDFQKVEDALLPYERDQAHIIMPSIEDPTKPMVDIQGNPVVIRFRFWVPEEVMKMAGLGNFAARLDRLVRGRDKWENAPMDVLKRAGRTAVESATMTPGLFADLADENPRLDSVDRILRVLPIARPLAIGLERGRDYGPTEGIKAAVPEFLGIKRAQLMRRGSTPSDADLVIARAKKNDAKRAMHKALFNAGPTEKQEAIDKYKEAVEEYRRIAKIIGGERAGED
jgi:hypothetical protein